MITKHLRRTAAATATAALTIGGLMLQTGIASAGTTVITLRNTGHGVGVYTEPNGTSAKWRGVADLSYQDGDYIRADCWTVGQSIGNQGDVWYATSEVDYGATDSDTGFNPDAWTFAPYVDGAAAFHNGLPRC